MVNLICLCSFINFSIFFHSCCLSRPASASSSPRQACNLAKTRALLHVCLIFSLVIAFLIHNSQLNSISRGAYWIYGASLKVAPCLNEFAFLCARNLFVLSWRNLKTKDFLSEVLHNLQTAPNKSILNLADRCRVLSTQVFSNKCTSLYNWHKCVQLTTQRRCAVARDRVWCLWMLHLSDIPAPLCERWKKLHLQQALTGTPQKRKTTRKSVGSNRLRNSRDSALSLNFMLHSILLRW